MTSPQNPRTVVEIPLPLAAATLHLTWPQAYAELLSGRLIGVRRGTRWFVTFESVESLRKEKGL